LVFVGLGLCNTSTRVGPNLVSFQFHRQLPSFFWKYFDLNALIHADLDCVTC
jgi:hypothetical protein